ncbi:uncharacterized protein LOC105429674 [Pogonomyrmex barbatus]|uniref:Uncharacterized protein LOC105429674 n=1 Tax=Pogonomyrmex barbatus TaxID=144034 RepID=A0A6I9WF04_9HYME|nr:uncharacterized protein LOC105429674 [Pogonomyrmex barbatus]
MLSACLITWVVVLRRRHFLADIGRIRLVERDTSSGKKTREDPALRYFFIKVRQLPLSSMTSDSDFFEVYLPEKGDNNKYQARNIFNSTEKIGEYGDFYEVYLPEKVKCHIPNSSVEHRGIRECIHRLGRNISKFFCWNGQTEIAERIPVPIRSRKLDFSK